MEKQDLYELIGQYLSGNLPGDRCQEVERRMAKDETFRREVELHRRVKENFSDPVRWRLRMLLNEVMEEPSKPPGDPPVEKSQLPWWKWVALLMGAALLAFLAWQWLKHGSHSERPDASSSPLGNVVDSSLQIQMQGTQSLPEKDTVRSKPSSPPASAPASKSSKQTPKGQPVAADFNSDKIMEGWLDNTRRGNKYKFSLDAPVVGDTLPLNQNGEVVVPFIGTASGFRPGSEIRFNLRIFNNKDSKVPQSVTPIKLNADAAGNAVLDIKPALRLPQGLYYFQLEKSDDGVVLGLGKFIINK